jgi:hypothetical protein
MQILILVRYGEHEAGRLNEKGVGSMLRVAHELFVLENLGLCKIVCADISRAIESATIISEAMKIAVPLSLTELYAAEEDGVGVDLDSAMKVIETQGANVDTLIVVCSREYIEVIPKMILSPSLAEVDRCESLQRGQFLLIDLERRAMEIIGGDGMA